MIRPLRSLWHQLMSRLAGPALVDDLTRLFGLVGKPRWTTPVLLSLGITAAFAEAFGITLILLFLYVALDQTYQPTAGFAGQLLQEWSATFSNTPLLAAAILGMILARALISYANGRVSAKVSERISQRARDSIHQQYLDIDYGFLQEYQQAELMETLGTETWLVARAYWSWTQLMINGCSITVYTLFLFALSWKITLIAVVGSLVISTIARRFARRARALGAQMRLTHRELGEHMLMTIQGMRTIRAYGQETVHQRRFEQSSQKAFTAAASLDQMSGWLAPLTEVGYLGILCLIVGGVEWWGTGFAVTMGAVVLLYRLQPQVRQLEGNLIGLAQMEPQLRSLRAMMEKHDKHYPAPGDRSFEKIERDIRFDGVRFIYPSSDLPALDGASFTIPAGKSTALVGASGSGKTTIVNMLLRLYDLQEGTIEVDGMPLGTVRRDHWLGRTAVAGQDVDLVEGTVIDNIRMADNTATLEDVVAAAQAAGVAEFVDLLPKRYDSWIGQEGLRFSGGQRQRIGLARALLRDANFLILDEATSALDITLEARIREEINARMVGRTMLIITHRLDFVREVDHVVWIEKGKVRAEGPPDEIFASGLAAISDMSINDTDG